QSPVAQLFDYGTVPLDFVGMGAAVLAPAAAATGVLVAASQSAQWSANALKAGSAASAMTDKVVPELAAVANSLQAAPDAAAATPAAINLANQTAAAATQANTARAAAIAAEAGFAANIAAAVAVGAIQIATTIIASIAMDQFMAIITAQSRLEGALATAQSQTISLANMVSTPEGMDQLRWHFAQAVGNAPVLPEAPALLTLAQAGNAKAAAVGYAVPK